MDDRFDFILVGNDVMNGTNKLKYVTNTYTAVGNDGQHFNKSINASPTNTAVPANVADALYYMSDHLPILMKVYYDAALSVDENNHLETWSGYFYNNNFMFKSDQNENNLNVLVFDVVGKLVENQTISNANSFKLNLSNLTQGLYFVKVASLKEQKTFRIVKQ